MKKKLTLLVITIVFSSLVFGQTHFPQENFYSIKARMDAFYDSIAAINGRAAVNEDESGYGQYQRWVYFWEPLVQPSGEFTIPLNAMNKLANDYLSTSHAPVSTLGNWTELGPNVQPSEGPSVSQIGSTLGGTGVAHFIITDPQDPTFLVTGSPAGGLFYSPNSGADWLNANTDNTLPILSISHCAIDPNNSNNWFVSTGDKTAIFDGSHATAWNITTGIYRKTGSGFNWQRIADETDLGASDGAGGVYSGWQIHKLLIDNANSSIMYAATSFGLYKTINALEPVASNVIWTRLNSIDDPSGLQAISDIEFKPGSSSILYATRDYANYIPGSTANILASNDFGVTWNSFNAGITLTNVRRIEIEVSQNPSDVDMLVVMRPDIQ